MLLTISEVQLWLNRLGYKTTGKLYQTLPYLPVLSLWHRPLGRLPQSVLIPHFRPQTVAPRPRPCLGLLGGCPGLTCFSIFGPVGPVVLISIFGAGQWHPVLGLALASYQEFSVLMLPPPAFVAPIFSAPGIDSGSS